MKLDTLPKPERKADSPVEFLAENPVPIWHPFPECNRTLWAPFESGKTSEGIVVVHPLPDSDEARFVLEPSAPTPFALRRALVVARELAVTLGCASLVTQDKVPFRDELREVFDACGFVALDESWTFEIPFSQLAVRVEALFQRLLKFQALPENACLESLLPHVDAVGAALESARLMDAFQLRARLQLGAKKQISIEHSCVLLIQGQLAGTILVAETSQPGTYEIPIRWVAPFWRQTSVNAMLIHHCIMRGSERNVQSIRFNANSINHRETIGLASKAGGQLIGTSHRYGLTLEGPRFDHLP